MKILHTSDWHIGQTLYGQKRYVEFEAFFDWLIDLIRRESVDALVVAGDIFDTSTPSNRAQTIYYRFLHEVSQTTCRHVIVVGGNHDSPTFLNAPKALLSVLNVHVVGEATQELSDEVFELTDGSELEAVVCAVPFLRDRDLRVAEASESIDDKNAKLVEGLAEHYRRVTEVAEAKREAYFNKTGRRVPLIATGHLFTAGAKTSDGDGVRELYVGSLAHVGGDIFPPAIDYLALGHIHGAQLINGDETRRYCGSPLAMGFGEAGQEKSVLLVEFDGQKPSVKKEKVPVFQALMHLSGDKATLEAKIDQLVAMGSNAWVEIEYTGKDVWGNLREFIEQSVINTDLLVCRIKNKYLYDRSIEASREGTETLDELTPNEVFDRCLAAYEIPEESRAALKETYEEVLTKIQQKDSAAD